MPVEFEIRGTDGSILLDKNTRPIGKKVIYNPITSTGSVSGEPEYGAPNGFVFLDPQTKTKYNFGKCYYANTGVNWKYGVMPAYQLNDGVSISFSCILSSTYCIAVNNRSPNGTVLGRTASIDMADSTLDSSDDKYISMYDTNGTLMWSLASLANSVQKLFFYVKNYENVTYNNANFYYDIPEGVDISKVFFTVLNNDLPNIGDNEVSTYQETVVKRVGRRFYFMPSYRYIFNYTAQHAYDNMNSVIAPYYGALQQTRSLKVMFWYLPSA